MIDRTEIAPGYSISRLMKGGWHLAGGHGSVDTRQAISDMRAFVEAGITTFDCADHYTGVEQLIGDFSRAHPNLGKKLQIHTKYVPDLGSLATLQRHDIVRIIDRSLLRLGVDTLDLVQFFWWDWSVKGAVDTAVVLGDLQREGKIRLLGVTNFNTDQFRELLDAGANFTVNQLQYSLVDRRPDYRMRRFCMERGIALLTYGHLLGGFFSADWLGKPEPVAEFTNRSLTKYKLIIDDFGGWELFQRLLRTMSDIGARHDVGIGEVALRWTLDRPGVAGCIVGATSTRHLAANTRVFDFALTDADRAALASVTDERSGPAGDCYQLENDRTGRHGRIMRYNQNALPAAGDNKADPAIRDLRSHFARFRAADPKRLHFAAHSHHLWPDVTEAAQAEVWTDAALRVDDKWGLILGTVWQEVSTGIARHLNLPDPATLVPAPNTHELILRLLSCCPPHRAPRVLATDGEFHSFRRQAARLAEDGMIELTTVPVEPFASLAERFGEAARAGEFDIVFASQVLFGSGFALTDLTGFVDAVAAPGRLIVLDGYHGFLARPTDLAPIADRAFYLAGGYKYAMGGEGTCFLHCPPGFAPRPRNTGWYARFGTLSQAPSGVDYTTDGRRFMGATFDPSGLYRQRAALRFLEREGLDAAAIHAHALGLQRRFLDAVRELALPIFDEERLVVKMDVPHGNFLTFDHPDASKWYDRLRAANIVTDVRGTRLRVGFGLYHGSEDIDRLATRLSEIA
jgi:aryl-alcohol dehydrogenase-like predicted oxidoreductase/selenocysteine lyase/cysteine desulfurase